ncbi:MAG: hypothetical protein HZC16_01675 [Candidatus Omnitrophica bacterium]|nr:hypothetical protein [Candidatus Omnitrophota bacterium]
MIEITKPELKKEDTMLENKKDKATGVTCSLCGEREGKVRKLIGGPNMRICDVCVKICNAIFAGESGKNLSGCKEADSSKQVEIKKEG